jgi:hypothetical protein
MKGPNMTLAIFDWAIVGVTTAMLGSAADVLPSTDTFTGPEKTLAGAGALAAMVAWFMWRDRARDTANRLEKERSDGEWAKREDRMAKRIDSLESYQQGEMMRRVEISAAAMEKTAEAINGQSAEIHELIASQRSLTEEMLGRPCLMTKERIKEIIVETQKEKS